MSSTLRTCSCKTCLFSYAFRLTIVDFFREFFKFKLVIRTMRTCSCKACLFSNAFRLTIVVFFREFFKFKLVISTMRTCSCKTCLFSNAFRLTIVDFFREFTRFYLKPWPPNNSHALRKYFTASGLFLFRHYSHCIHN